jgi:hypothetical protein
LTGDSGVLEGACYKMEARTDFFAPGSDHPFGLLRARAHVSLDFLSLVEGILDCFLLRIEGATGTGHVVADSPGPRRQLGSWLGWLIYVSDADSFG